MLISLLDISKPGDNKDYNGGFGTTFSIGNSFKSKLLKLARKKGENIPLITLAYLSAIFKKNEHQVILDSNHINKDADIIILLPSLIRFQEECETLKKIPEITKAHSIVLGPLVSAIPERYDNLADTVITGEPETFFEHVKNMSDIPTGRVISKQVEDLNQLAFPDWTLFNYKEFTQSPIFKKSPTVFIQGSRSCPYTCNYCPYIANDSKYRRRTIENVLAELNELKEKYKFKAVMFRDPVFTMNRKWTVELCQAIIDEGLIFEFGCETRTDRLDEELLSLMYKAGFRAIKIGVESPEIEVLKKYKRKAPDQLHQEEIVSFAEKLGIRVIAFYILGLPDDNKESMQNTLDYSINLKTSLANFTICTPIPGTEFYDLNKEKIIDTNLNKYDNFHSVLKLEHLSAKEVEDFQDYALTSYYFRFNFLISYLKNKFLRD